MQSLDIIVNFFKQGGAFLYPIALVWVVGLVIAVERFIYLNKVGGGNKSFWGELQPLLEGGRFKEALAAATASDTALAQVMRYGLSRIPGSRRRDDVEKAMEDAVIRTVQRIAFQFSGAIIGIQTELDAFGTLRKDREVDAAVACMRAQWRISAGLKPFGQDVHGEGTRNKVDSGGRVTANERA